MFFTLQSRKMLKLKQSDADKEFFEGLKEVADNSNLDTPVEELLKKFNGVLKKVEEKIDYDALSK